MLRRLFGETRAGLGSESQATMTTMPYTFHTLTGADARDTAHHWTNQQLNGAPQSGVQKWRQVLILPAHLYGFCMTARAGARV